MKFVADTSVWIHSLNRDDPALDAEPRLETLDHVFATDVICAELLTAPDRDRQARLVDRLSANGHVLVLNGVADMRIAADCMRASIQAGRTVRSMTDCLIAAVCIRERIPLLHNDRDFDTLAEITPLRVLRI